MISNASATAISFSVEIIKISGINGSHSQYSPAHYY